MLPENVKDKSFWEKPENWTGVLLGAGLVAAGGWALYAALPFIITLLENAMYATFLGVAAVTVGSIVTSKKFWQLGGILLRRLAWHLTNAIITIDPIGILKDYVQGLHKKVSQIDENIKKLSGVMRKLKEQIESNAQEAASALRMASRAKKENKKAVFVLKARRAGRRQEANMELKDVAARLDLLYRVLNKMKEAAQFYIEDIEDHVEVANAKYESSRAANRAAKMVQRIIHGDSDKELYLQTMSYLADDYAQKIGEIEHIMNMSSSVIDTVDLQNGVYEEEAMKMLEEWEKKGDSLILGDTKSTLIQQAYDPNDELDLDTDAGVRQEVKKTDFGKLFN